MSKRRETVTNTLRQRITTMMEAGSLKPGDRLPGTRLLATQLGVSPRLVLGVVQQLADEGLIERRERSGIYVSARARWGLGRLERAAAWLTEVLAQGVAYQLPARELPDALRLVVETPARGVVVAPTVDQIDGICRELRADFGVDAVGVHADDLADPARVPKSLQRCDLVVSTDSVREQVAGLARRLDKPAVTVGVRSDLADEVTRLLLRGRLYVVVADARFAAFLMEFFERTPLRRNLVPLVVGRDDVSTIPGDALVYVTQSARARLGDRPLPGQLMPTARVLSLVTAREIFAVLVRRSIAGIGERD
ncbi:MAG TPA: GntR family transcriptional regulator [Gemmatimonadaceae bacterium]|nr:GntR family transcriptional regulator [Gemmatimonadaceae bacterium]